MMITRRRKGRKQIPIEVAARVLFLADRVCCVCRVEGKAVQIHHIDDDPANNDESNLAVLCLDCHHLTQIEGGFARNLDAAQVTLYRDDWNERVARAATLRQTRPRAESLPDSSPELDRTLWPRRLHDYQRNCIRDSLAAIARHPGGLQIAVHAASGSDADDYAHEFVLLFRSVAFHIGKWGLFQDHEEIASGDRYGVWVRWSSDREKEYGLPPIGKTLVATLSRCGVDVTPLDLKGDAFLELIVYRRRPVEKSAAVSRRPAGKKRVRAKPLPDLRLSFALQRGLSYWRNVSYDEIQILLTLTNYGSSAASAGYIRLQVPSGFAIEPLGVASREAGAPLQAISEAIQPPASAFVARSDFLLHPNVPVQFAQVSSTIKGNMFVPSCEIGYRAAAANADASEGTLDIPAEEIASVIQRPIEPRER